MLKNRLSEYVRLAASGEVVLVTDRDRVVAELRAPAGRGPTVSDAALADLMRRGVLSAPLVASTTPPPRVPMAPLADMLAELSHDRDAR